MYYLVTYVAGGYVLCTAAVGNKRKTANNGGRIHICRETFLLQCSSKILRSIPGAACAAEIPRGGFDYTGSAGHRRRLSIFTYYLARKV